VGKNEGRQRDEERGRGRSGRTLRKAIVVAARKELEGRRRSQVEGSAEILRRKLLGVENRNADVDDVEVTRSSRVGVGGIGEVELGRLGFGSAEDERRGRVGSRVRVGGEDKTGDGASESWVEERGLREQGTERQCRSERRKRTNSDFDETGNTGGKTTLDIAKSDLDVRKGRGSTLGLAARLLAARLLAGGRFLAGLAAVLALRGLLGLTFETLRGVLRATLKLEEGENGVSGEGGRGERSEKTHLRLIALVRVHVDMLVDVFVVMVMVMVVVMLVLVMVTVATRLYGRRCKWRK
jgi:hypothetical protein